MYDIKINLVVKNPVSIISTFYFPSILPEQGVCANFFFTFDVFLIWIFVLFPSFLQFAATPINQIKTYYL